MENNFFIVMYIHIHISIVLISTYYYFSSLLVLFLFSLLIFVLSVPIDAVPTIFKPMASKVPNEEDYWLDIQREDIF